jgi:diguanylate cyclase (GGDEF)-like protein
MIELEDCSASRIVIVDDDPVMVRVLSQILSPLGCVRFALDSTDALSLMRRELPELVLLDAELPGISGLGLCRSMQSDALLSEIPVIFITRHSEAELQVECFEAGAVDFVQKPVQAPVLLARVRTHIRLKRLSDRLRHTASVDPLTNVANRRVFDQTLDNECRRAERAKQPLSLMLLDIDHFKAFNDTYGHTAGDECLRRFATTLRQVARASDLVARYGGEEFAVLLPDTHTQGAMAVADRLQARLQLESIPHAASPVAAHVTASVGISTYAPSEDKLAHRHQVSDRPCGSELVISVDRALYDAKNAGRSRISALPFMSTFANATRVADS